jgi:hypothetical protein
MENAVSGAMSHLKITYPNNMSQYKKRQGMLVL